MQPILIKIEEQGVTVRQGNADYIVPFIKLSEEIEPAGLDDLVTRTPPAALLKQQANDYESSKIILEQSAKIEELKTELAASKANCVHVQEELKKANNKISHCLLEIQNLETVIENKNKNWDAQYNIAQRNICELEDTNLALNKTLIRTLEIFTDPAHPINREHRNA